MIPDRVILHCSATKDGLKSTVSVDEVRRWHVEDNGWNDIGYHYYVTRDGKRHDGRELHVQGAGVLGENEDTVHVCYEGTYFPSLKQIKELIVIYIQLNQKFGITINEWFGHNEFANKECPGFPIEDFKAIILLS